MIHETRQITFTNSALKKAFSLYATVPNQSDLPHGLIAAIVPRPNGGVVLTVQQYGATKLRDVSFTPSKTLGVLLYFCRKQHIPIPREAEKGISGAGEQLILSIICSTRAV
jgi:hypothetical protein